MPSFRPSAHGWPFADDYDCPAALIGLGRPVAPDFGLAGGMCWAALDRFFAGRRIARTRLAPGPEDALYAEFVLRLTNALAKDVIARAASAQRLPAAGRGRSLGRVSRSEWATAQKELDADRPVLLLLLRDTGPFADPTDSRFVLATRYDADADRAMVWVYDPRRPGDDAATLMLDPGKGGEPFRGRLGREEAVHALLAVPYDRPKPPRVAYAVSPGGEGRRVGLEEALAPVDLGGGALGLLARDTEAHLVHVRRDGDGWHRERPADRGDVGADFRFEGAPVAAGVTAGRPSAVVRGVNGHLLHLRRGSRGWSAEDLTDQPNTGLRFRIAGDPVVLSEGRRPAVAAVNHDGRLLRYSWSTVRGWSAENLSKESGAEPLCRLEGPVAGVRDTAGHAHVLGRNADGELVHFREEPDGRWRGVRPGAGRAELRGLLLDGPPVARCTEDGAIEAFARGVGGHLLRFRLPAGGRWTGQDITADAAGGAPSLTLASEPCVAGTAAGLRHVLGRNADGEVVHYMGAADGTWRAENLTTDRITIGPQFRVEGQPAAVAGGRSVLLAGRRGAELLLYRWHGTDWVAENLTVERGGKDDGPRIGSDPVVAAAGGAAHVLALSASGKLVHYRVEADVGPRVATTGLAALAGALPAVVDLLRGLMDRFRRPREAVGLRASPRRPGTDAAADGDADPGEERAAAAAPATGGRVDRAAAPAAADGTSQDPREPAPDPDADRDGEALRGDGTAGEDRVADAAGVEDGAERPWGRPTGAPAPWHEEPDEGEADGADAGEPGGAPAEAGPRRPAPRSEPERDLLREGSEWSGPRLVEDKPPAPPDDWDLALRDVAAAHERALVGDGPDEVVDEEDPAAARIFRPGHAAETPSSSDPGTSSAESGAKERASPSPAAAPREPSTEPVPGRPLVDLSFLSDIVHAAGHDEADAPETDSGEAPQPAVEAAPPKPPPSAAPPTAGKADTGGSAGNGGRAATPSQGRPSAAPPQPAAEPAAEPVVDLEFLVTAGEYVGGGAPADGLASFLQFIEQG